MEIRLETKQMKLTKQTLKQIIKEELDAIMSEQSTGFVQGTPMRGIMKYQPEIAEGEDSYMEPFVGESLSYELEAEFGYQTGTLKGRIAPVIAIISFQRAKDSGDQEAMERHAENAKNVWSLELNMKENPEKQEAFKQGLLNDSINFKVNQEIFRARRKRKR